MRYVGERRIVIDDAPTPCPLWLPDRSFEGQSVVIVGGGPSHGRMDIEALRGHSFIVANSGCRKVRPVATASDILYFSDNSWAENRPAPIADWPGVVVTSNRNAKARLGDRVRYIDITALTERMRCAPDHVQASSGHTAACLAVDMGASRLVLIGFEARSIDGRTHGHGDYSQHDLAAFDERFVPGWEGLAPRFAELGVEVLNATPASAVTCFPTAEFSEALSR